MLPGRQDGTLIGRLARVIAIGSGGIDMDAPVFSFFYKYGPKHTFRQRRPADIAQTNKKDRAKWMGFHGPLHYSWKQSNDRI